MSGAQFYENESMNLGCSSKISDVLEVTVKESEMKYLLSLCPKLFLQHPIVTQKKKVPDLSGTGYITFKKIQHSPSATTIAWDTGFPSWPHGPTRSHCATPSPCTHVHTHAERSPMVWRRWLTADFFQEMEEAYLQRENRASDECLLFCVELSSC